MLSFALVVISALAVIRAETECVCTKERIPVCGSDGQTYGNLCVATCHGVTVAHEGDCHGDEESHGVTDPPGDGDHHHHHYDHVGGEGHVEGQDGEHHGGSHQEGQTRGEDNSDDSDDSRDNDDSDEDDDD